MLIDDRPMLIDDRPPPNTHTLPVIAKPNPVPVKPMAPVAPVVSIEFEKELPEVNYEHALSQMFEDSKPSS